MRKEYLFSILFHVLILLVLIITNTIAKKQTSNHYERITDHVNGMPKSVTIKKKDQKIVGQVKIISGQKIKEEKALQDHYKKLLKNNMKKVHKGKSIKSITQKKKILSNIKKIKPKDKEAIESIFSNTDIKNTIENSSNNPVYLNNNDYVKIKKQLQKNWTHTPCLENMNVKVHILIDANCNIIYRYLGGDYISSPQLRVCADSVLRATQKENKLALDSNSCKKYSQQLLTLNFIKNSIY